MPNDAIGGALGGAAQGAAIGSVVPGIGTAVGAVVGGALGFVGGLFSNKSKKRAKKAIRAANKLDEEAARLRSFAEQRNLLRSGQAVAAASLNSSVSQGVDVSSSAFQGSRSSIYTQLLDSFLIGEAVVEKQAQRNEQLAKANAATAQYESIGDITNAVFTAGAAFAGPIANAINTRGIGPPIQGAGQRIGSSQGAINFDSGVRTFPVPGYTVLP